MYNKRRIVDIGSDTLLYFFSLSLSDESLRLSPKLLLKTIPLHLRVHDLTTPRNNGNDFEFIVQISICYYLDIDMHLVVILMIIKPS